jgi:hypothetical protein
MKYFILFFVTISIILSCKKNFDAEATIRKKPLAGIWAKQEPFYAPQGFYYVDSTNIWKPFIGFAFTSDDDPNKLGFYNPYNIGKGTNALGFKTIYANQTFTSDSGYYNLQIPKCFEFIPNSANSIDGIVNVIPQQVKCTRINKTVYFIGISGTGGTYNEISKTFEIEITFNESEIGGGTNVKRKYRFTP